MSKLQEIKDQVSKEYGRSCFEQLLVDMADGEGSDGLKWFENVLEQVARSYAQPVAEDALKRAAENALVSTIDVGGNEYKSKSEELAFPGDESLAKVSVDKQSILSTPINLEL